MSKYKHTGRKYIPINLLELLLKCFVYFSMYYNIFITNIKQRFVEILIPCTLFRGMSLKFF